MRKIYYSIIAVMLSISVLILYAPKTFAVSASDWRPGRIIDDVVFQNKASMTVDQIQQFLNSKVPTCDTNGTKLMWAGGPTRAQWSLDNGKDPAPYTCLKDYVENPTTKANNATDPSIVVPGGLSAAQLIYNAAQAQNINPQVFLVLLQKEQGLVTDDWPYASQFEKATGNNCPDTAPCNPAYAWLWTQVNNAGAQFNYYVTHFDNYNYAPGWNNILYNPNSSCGTQRVFIENAYTAALYIYTPYVPNQAALNNMYGTGDSCSSYGNRNFWRMFNDWFGGALANSTSCDSKVINVSCVWSLRKADGSQFLTTSSAELTNAIALYGWVNEGIAFYASSAPRPGTIPVYRLRLNSEHYYTSDQADYNTKTGAQGWSDEGVAFYEYDPSTSTSASYKAYRLYKASINQYYLTIDASKKNSLIGNGYVLQPTPFNTLSGMAELLVPSEGRSNIYVLLNGTRELLTSNIGELDAALRGGYTYDKVVTTFNSDASGTPVYRLQTLNGYFYTSNLGERRIATQNYGMVDEGIVFYLDDGSATIFRLSNLLQNRYYYTENINEVMRMVNTSGWKYEGSLYDKSGPYPVLRFLNTVNGKHFYTINVYEAAKITNTHWKYEVVSFYASRTTGDPIYRLRLNDKYFFTNNINEKDSAVSKYGYTYEGVGFYASPTPTAEPVLRLQGSNDEYFYTRSNTERDSAVSKYGYTYEGVGFYAL